MLQNIYVDDFLKSTPDVATAVEMIPLVTDMLETGSFYLTKFLSNLHQVLLTIPEDKKVPSVKQHAIDHKLPFERALGMKWDVEEDAFLYTIAPKDKSLARRGFLSVTSPPCMIHSVSFLQ